MNRPTAGSRRADGGSPSGTENVRPVEVRGRERIVVSGTEEFGRTTRTCTVACASGERTTDTWIGVPISTLAEAAEFPGATTHLQVEADDFAAQVSIRAVLDGVLAFDRLAGDGSKLPRLIADVVSGERLVKRVRRVSAVELAPDDEPRVGRVTRSFWRSGTHE